ncbi:hypothetical protein [Hafnia alvei]|uniref:Uncharacterized protein n=1 Tax=Hafnia alvei TaxID=569 RepID=A0A1C6Z6M7_HAFAL|nr:hypothetical protein [Hafnia alvei]SCM54751.1 hypothetical protein BN1044_04262 [Hafnia alvei]
MLTLFTLSACIVQEPKDISLDDAAIMVNDTDVKNDGMVKNQFGVTTGARCLETLSFLINEDPKKYNGFAGAYHDLAERYRFLNENSAVMDPDAREMYSMSLSMRKDLLCSKLRFAGYQLIKDKMNF